MADSAPKQGKDDIRVGGESMEVEAEAVDDQSTLCGSLRSTNKKAGLLQIRPVVFGYPVGESFL